MRRKLLALVAAVVIAATGWAGYLSYLSDQRDKIFALKLPEGYTVLDQSVRPDGEYSIAIAVDQDPEFPELWIADHERQEIFRLKSSGGYGIIDWPGERIFWESNDSVARAFDEINGFTRFEFSVDSRSFEWLGEMPRDSADTVADEWWVDTTSKEGVVQWIRVRSYTDGAAQVFRPYGSAGRYHYYLTKAIALKRVSWGGYPVSIDAAGVVTVDRSKTDYVPERLQALVREKKLIYPSAELDEELAAQLLQRLN